MEDSEVFKRVIEQKVNRRRLIFKIATQAVIMAVMVLIVSLALTAFIVVKLHLVNLMPMAIICACITMTFTIVGMILVNLWNQI